MSAPFESRTHHLLNAVACIGNRSCKENQENEVDEAVVHVKSLFASKRARRLSKKKQRALARKMKKEEKLRMTALKEMEEAENANGNENHGMVEER